MKTIGLVDYYISEWHANNYVGWIENICKTDNKDFAIKYAYSEIEDSPFDGRKADDWCKDFGVERCPDIKTLCEKSDYIMVLAPSDPDKHLKYAEQVFKFCNGKNVYIDKTFAPDYKTALEIYALADKYGVKFFTSSALRYATEIDEFSDKNDPEFHTPKNAIITFGGGTAEEYLVHPLEIAIKLLGVGVEKVKTEKLAARQYAFRATYKDGKGFMLVYSPRFDFIIDAIEADDLHFRQRPVVSATFNALLKDVLRFFETGEVSFDRSQTLEIMKVREQLIKAADSDGQWITITKD